MKITHHIPDHNDQRTEEQRLVDQKKEYKLVETFLRTPGTRLFGYDVANNELYCVEEVERQTVHLINTDDTACRSAMINTNHEYFEAISWKTARKRINKYQSEKIRQLSNLRKKGNGINFF